MNPISYAIDQVMLKIPRDVLDRAFLYDLPYARAIPTSVAARIREQVVERRVMVDCNLVGGMMVEIPLYKDVEVERIDAYNTVYRIPKTLTQGRKITRALSLVFGEGSVLGTAQMGMRRGNPMLDGAAGILSSHMPIPNVSTAYVSVIGENVILVRENYSLPKNVFLRCWIENDDNMNHLEPTSYQNFAKLVLYATQSYVYNQLVVALDRGAISAGSELGRIRDIIDGFSDAEENYETFFKEVWRKTALFNDKNAKMRHLKRITGGLW
jgi:hypothetical protein